MYKITGITVKSFILLLLSKTNQRDKKIEDPANGKSALFVYNDKITYIDFDNYDNIDIILNLMFSSDYLTVDKVIVDKAYYKELVLDKVKDIHKVAIVFNGKKCIVR